MTTNEWYKAAQLGDSYWLYVVWDPLYNPDPDPLKIRNPVKHLDHAKREVVRYFDIPVEAILNVAKAHGELVKATTFIGGGLRFLPWLGERRT